jgi:hypothetical protein
MGKLEDQMIRMPFLTIAVVAAMLAWIAIKSPSEANSSTGRYLTNEAGVVILSGTGLPVRIDGTLVEPDGPREGSATKDRQGGEGEGSPDRDKDNASDHNGKGGNDGKGGKGRDGGKNSDKGRK